MSVNIAGLNKAELLAALYNGSKVQGMGIFQAKSGAMTTKQAQEELDNNPSGYFDYLHGKVMKVRLNEDEMRTDLYNRDNGYGKAERIIESLRKSAV